MFRGRDNGTGTSAFCVAGKVRVKFFTSNLPISLHIPAITAIFWTEL